MDLRRGLTRRCHEQVVDAGNHLIDGERRLLACEALGWTEIDARDLGDLSEDERWDIELEENELRKDLSDYERNKTRLKRVQLAERRAMEEQAAQVDLRSATERKSRGHRPEAGSLRDVSDRTGIPVTTIHTAKQHVAAVEKYSPLGAPDIGQAEAIALAKALDAAPPEQQPVLE